MAIIAEFTTVKPELAHSKTYEDFYKFLGARPTRLGIVSKMYEHLTASYLTEGLGNIMYNSQKTGSKFQKINSLMFEWEIDVNFIKRIEFAAVPTGNGANGSDITMQFTERYFERNDTFIIEESKQQCIVMEAPIRKSDNFWEYSVRLIDSTYKETLDATSCQIGMTTRFVSNIQPEYHEEGFAKFQSNIEKHRNWITEHRIDVNYSSRYALTEDVFLKISNGEDGGAYKEAIFKMPKAKEQALASFMEARNNALLLQKGTMDVNGKSSIIDKLGRPLIAGDGAIPQINRFAGKYNYSKLSVSVFNKAITTMTQKAASPGGNTFVFVCNEVAYADVQTTLAEYLNNFKVLNSYIYSQAEGKTIKVGATYSSYEFLNNTIVFKVDRALSREYPNKGYAILVDLTADKASGQPALQLFSLKGAEFTSNTLAGVGGLDGSTSGVVSTPVAGSKLINSGFAGIGVFTPYRAFILLQS
jgi:hypothetical protein